MIWSVRPTVDALNAACQGNMASHLGMVVTEVGDDFIRATMPVDERTVQPMGLLHGGASVALAETLGSMAGFVVAGDGARVVGLEINANHVRAVRNGLVTGTARPLHLGRTTQVWDIRVTDSQDRLVCVSRLTLAVR
ncbi:MAG: hotdog fold thioesterase [Bacteroidota bacterium]